MSLLLKVKINDDTLRKNNRKRVTNLNYSTDIPSNSEIGFLTIALLIILFIFIVLFINSFISFKKDRDYIKMEMDRSFGEREYLYWKRKLKMLYISKIPVVNYIVKQKHKRKHNR